jgi:ABC-type branched-subunit amino acid transport system substrate-binding protein
MSKKQIFIIAICFVSIILIFQMCADDSKAKSKSIKIGVLSPITDVRVTSEMRNQAAAMAVKEINSAGGIDIDGESFEIELVIKDDGGTVEQALKKTKEFHNAGIDIIIGPAWSSLVLGISEAYTIPNNMLIMSYTSTNPTVGDLDDNDLVWRVPPSDKYQASAGADYVYNTLNKTSAGILYRDDDWGIGLAESFKSAFESLGGTVNAGNFVDFPSATGDDVTADYSEYLGPLFSGEPEAIYLVIFPAEGAKITMDIETGGFANYGPAFFSNDGPYTDDLLVNGHKNILKGMRGTQPTPPSDYPNNKTYCNNFKNKFGYEAGSYSQHIYDAVYLMAYAMLKANSTDPNDVASNLQSVSGGGDGAQGAIINVDEFAKSKKEILAGNNINYEGASGSIDFDKNGDPSKAIYIIWRIEESGSDLKFVEETSIEYSAQ